MRRSEKAILNFFEADHSRLDDLFNRFLYHKRDDPALARKYYDEFSGGLRRHIVWEDEILFPIFEKKSSIPSVGPTATIRSEHREILKILQSIGDRLHCNDFKDNSEEKLLAAILGAHNRREENIMYSAIDRSLTVDEKRQVFDAIEKFLPHWERKSEEEPAKSIL